MPIDSRSSGTDRDKKMSPEAEDPFGTAPARPTPTRVEIDYKDPAKRFQLLSTAKFDKQLHATILDLKTQEKLRVSEGDKLADSGYRVERIDTAKRSVYLRGPNFDTVALRIVARPG